MTREPTDCEKFPLCRCGCGQEVGSKWARYMPSHYDRDAPEYIVNEKTGCWEWNFERNRAGYGRKTVKGRVVFAHRYMYEKLVGPIPDGLFIDHLCRVRHCVNPAHMEPVTKGENNRRGEQTKLTPEQVAEIKASSKPRKTLREEFGVSKSLIAQIKRGEKWRDIMPLGAPTDYQLLLGEEEWGQNEWHRS